MPGLVEQHTPHTSAATAERRGLRARWRRLVQRFGTLLRRPDRRPNPQSGTAEGSEGVIREPQSTRSVADPITPEVQDLIQAAFPCPRASVALQSRVADICRPPTTASRGIRLIPPFRARTRNGLAMPGGGCSARFRWGALGALATLLLAIWLAIPRVDVLAAAIRATEAAPVIHMTAQTPTRSEEWWFMPGVGLRITIDEPKRPMITVDDRKRQYRYFVAEGRVEIEPSDLAQPGWMRGIQWEGAEMLKQIRSWTGPHQTETDIVTENGVPLRRARVTLPKGGQMSIFIDPKTDRIARVEIDAVREGGKRYRRTAELDYPEPATVDRSLFRFQMPKGVWIQDHTGGEGQRPEGEDERCWKHMDGVMKAMWRFVDEHDGHWPNSLREVLGPYEGADLLRCPLDPKGGPDGTSYRYHRPGPEVIAKIKAIEELRKQHGKVKLPFPWPYDVILLEHCHGRRPILYFDAVGRTMDVRGPGSHYPGRSGKHGAAKRP